MAAGAAVLFPRSGSGRPAREGPVVRLLTRPLPIVIVMALLGIANGVTKHGIQPILVKTTVEKRGGELLHEEWNSFSRIMAHSRGRFPPNLWGASPKLPRRRLAEQISLTIDVL